MNNAPADEKLRAAVELFEMGVRLMRENLRRQFPDARHEEIEARLMRWLHDRPGAEEGDAAGRAIRLPSVSR